MLLQRGLRINPKAKALWLQSFCLELHYIQKLRGRREILQLQQDIAESKNDRNENDKDVEVDKSLKLPEVIFTNAIKSIPDDAAFRIQFMRQCKLFPQTQTLINLILESVEKDFQNVEEVWIERARLMLEHENSDDDKDVGFLKRSDSDQNEENDTTTSTRKRKRVEISEGDEKILEILKEATDSIQTPQMFLKSLTFLRLYFSKMCISLEEDSDDADGVIIMKERMTAIIRFSVQLMNEAESKVSMTPELAIEMANCLSEFGLPSQSQSLMKRLTNDNLQCKNDSKCWLKIVELSESSDDDDENQKEKNLKSSNNILRKALKWIPIHDPGHLDILSKLFLNLLSSTKTNKSKDDELSSTYEKILLISHQKDNQGVSIPILSLAYLRHVRMMNGDNDDNHFHLLRRVYSKFLFHSNYCESPPKTQEDAEIMKDIFDECLLVERMLMKKSTFKSGNDKQQKRHLLNLYDAAYKYFMDVNDKLANSYHQKGRELSY